VIVMCAMLSAAGADPVGDLGARNVAGIAKLADDEALGLAKDARVIEPRGLVIDRAAPPRDDCVVPRGIAKGFYCYPLASITHKTTRTLSVTAGDLGWFHITFVATTTRTGEKAIQLTERASGLALRSADGWAIQAIAYGDVVADTALPHRARIVHPPKDTLLDGDRALAATVAGWFAGGVAAHAARSPQLLASGTSPEESAAGAGALKLAKAWDRLGLRATAIEATLVAGGKAAWIRATVLLPRKGKNKPAFALELEAIVVPDGADWRWVSLHYFSPRPDSMEHVVDDDRLLLLTPAED
jgi:hypothetical protein